jgi:hypothetical protein
MLKNKAIKTKLILIKQIFGETIEPLSRDSSAFQATSQCLNQELDFAIANLSG